MIEGVRVHKHLFGLTLLARAHPNTIERKSDRLIQQVTV